MHRLLVPALLVLLTVTTMGAGWLAWHYRQARDAAQQSYATQVQVNDSTSALLATSRLRTDTLHSLLVAKDQLQGKLIAGMTIRVPARDTVLVHETLPTELSADSTRTAHFRDSTFAGVVTGTVTAPPCCQPLAVHYSVQRPAFAPSVGFVQVGDKQVAVVVWQGERAEIEAPYIAMPKPVKRFGAFVDAAGLVGGGGVVRGGVFARTSTAATGVYAAASQSYSEHQSRPQLEIGVHKEF